MAHYVDTSAFLKLVMREERSLPMRRWATAHRDDLFSSDLLRIEALRAAKRHSPEALVAARRRLEVLDLVVLTTSVCDRAADLDPSILRSLDALHLAAAMSVEDDLESIVTYDERLQAAARLHGVPTVAP